MADSRPGWFRRIVFWSFVLLMAVMTAYRLSAPPSQLYDILLAVFYAILLAMGLVRLGWSSLSAWPFAFVVLATSYVSYDAVWLSGRWAYRMTLEVETPEGMKTGAAIVRVEMNFYGGSLTDGVSCTMRGEAALVDLGERGRLIALLPQGAGKDGCMFVPRLVLTPNKRYLYGAPVGPSAFRRYGSLPPQTLPVPSDQLPTLIRFKDQNDSKSAEEVDPAALDRFFGEGVRLTRVTVTILDSGYWPFNSWGWPAGLAGIEVPKPTIMQNIPASPLSSYSEQLNSLSGHPINIYIQRFVIGAKNEH